MNELDPKTYIDERDGAMNQSRILTVKEVAETFRISKSSLYELIEKKDQNGFPVWNIGNRKKYVIPEKELKLWLAQRNITTSNIIPTGQDLIRKFKR